MWYRLWILRFLRFQAKIVWLQIENFIRYTHTHTLVGMCFHVQWKPTRTICARIEHLTVLSTHSTYSITARILHFIIFTYIFPARHSHELISGAENAILSFIHARADKGWRIGSTIFYIASAAMCDLDWNQLLSECTISATLVLACVSQSVSSENRVER